jgi:hypothetical protein
MQQLENYDFGNKIFLEIRYEESDGSNQLQIKGGKTSSPPFLDGF